MTILDAGTTIPRPPGTLLFPGSVGSLLYLASATPAGCFVEVGVYKGGVAWWLSLLAEKQGRELHLFDTFTGIPEKSNVDRQHNIGDFNDTSEIAVRLAVPNAHYHVGFFPATMPAYISPVAFIHVDCDQYASILACIDTFIPLMVPGGIMLFDDWDCTDGCRKAVAERYETVNLTREGKAFIIKN